MNYKLVGALRGLGVVVGIAVLHYLGTATTWEFLANPWLGGLIVSVVAAIEHNLEDKNGKALFGAVRV